jgi:predicted Co/Zn/Cd cation transporter (cation efflux family)
MLSLLLTQTNVLERTLLIIVTKQASICAFCTILRALKVPVITQVDSKFLCFFGIYSFIDLKIGKLTLSVPAFESFLGFRDYPWE